MALLDDKGLGYLVGKLKDMFAPKSHTHDDRYYTESEIDGKLSGKANSSHTHTKEQVGLGNVDNTADSVKSVNYANNAGTANEINPNNSYGSITKAVRPMFDSVRANRLAFLPSDQIIIEKTVDGGKTWTDAAITEYNKRALFSENGGGFTLPQIDGKKNALCGIRLTITGMKYDVPAGTAETAKYNYWSSKYVKDTERYCTIGDMFFWVSGGGDDISLVIERATGAASTSWANLFTSSNSTGYLEGWSGPNYIKFSENTLGGGTGQTSNWWNYRFTFMSHPWNGSAFNNNYITQAQNVTMIKAYGASVWTTPNNLMSNDHIYKWDVDENVAFPAIVSASGFNGTATKLARDGDLANPMTFNWKGKDGQPTWLWGGEDGGNMYVYNPSKFNVNSAKTAASADSAKKLTTNAGSATQPVYFSNGVPVATTYTLGKSVPSNAVFTDTNTWRGVQNNLTSDATDQSLSAAQGKVLKALVDGKAAANHTHSQYLTAHQDISGKVDKSEAGANNLLATLTTTWTATPTDDTYFVRQDTGGGSTFGRVKFSTLWSYIKGKGDAIYQPKGSYAASSHTHNYAGSSSAGGSANSAVKLDMAIDMRAIVGTPVMAAEDGTVEIVYHWNGKRTQGDTNSYGNMVKIRHANWNGGTLHTLYAHLNSINVKKGQVVKTGEVIGYSGNTGNSFGAHLHFEVRWKNKRTNPLVWLDNNFTKANASVFTFRAGEHSVDKSVGESDKPASANKQPADSTAVELWGIDVSRYQGNINWRKVAAAGVKFAMLRAVSTNKNGIYIDPTFEQNYKGARENGIPVGVYFFTYAQDEATQNKEFEMLFKALDGKTLQYPVALDIEDKNTASIGKNKLTALVKRGLDIIDQRGYKPMLYTYTNYKAAYLDMTKLAAYDLWLADYRNGVNQKGKCQMWQYSSKGAVAGIAGDCDMNWCYKAYVGETAGVSTPKPAQKAIVFKAGRWNVRKGPGTEYASVGVIASPDAKTGKIVTIGYSDIVNGWYKTLYGYVGPAAVASHT